MPQASSIANRKPLRLAAADLADSAGRQRAFNDNRPVAIEIVSVQAVTTMIVQSRTDLLARRCENGFDASFVAAVTVDEDFVAVPAVGSEDFRRHHFIPKGTPPSSIPIQRHTSRKYSISSMSSVEKVVGKSVSTKTGICLV